MDDEPRKSKAKRRVEALTERQRKIEAEILAAKNELRLENEREKEQQGAVAFLACVRRLDRGCLDSLKATVFGGFDANEAQISLVKDWFDTLITTPSTQAETNLSDSAEVAAIGISSDDTTAPIQQSATSDSAPLQNAGPSEDQKLPTKEVSAEPGDHHQADTAQTSPTFSETVTIHDGHQVSAVVAAKPLPIKELSVGAGDHIQTADKATPDTARSEDVSVVPQEIKDRLWRGDYLIEVEQKGCCQVIGMQAFGSPEDAMEHLARLEESARKGDESAKRVLATAAKAASEYR